jgi:hypothetical protein
MYLTAMTHRDELFDLTLRWMNDDFDPDDGRKLTRIFVYESAISTITIDRIRQFLGLIFQGRFRAERIRQKQALRDCIIAHCPTGNIRLEELTAHYRDNPKYYFPHLPIDALVLKDDLSRLVAICRIKRLSRVAEKVSFRLVDALYREIQEKAEQLAEQRAAVAGAPLAGFISSPLAMQNDFIEAETSVARHFMDGTVRIRPESMTVNDIIGFKIIGDQDLLDRIPLVLKEQADITIVEIEKHSGNYNAVNLLLDIKLPSPAVLAEKLSNFNWDMAGRRGLDPAEIRRNLHNYTAEGATTLRIELILTTYEELMEAEFGRSIHELRVLRLRQRQAYRGPLGQNAAYLIEYMLVLASSPSVTIEEIPIKMYGRYLPEEIAALKSALYGNTVEGNLLNSFSPDAPVPVQK